MHESTTDYNISGRERQTVELAANGMTDKEIARRMGVSLATVRTYWERLRVKTATRTRTHATCVVMLSDQPQPAPLSSISLR